MDNKLDKIKKKRAKLGKLINKLEKIYSDFNDKESLYKVLDELYNNHGELTVQQIEIEEEEIINWKWVNPPGAPNQD